MPEKKKAGKWYRTHVAIERGRRETWASGLVHFSQLCVCRGRIRLIPERDTGKIHTELWGSGVYLNLYWFADELPPTIREGEMATVIGNIQTYNLNDHVAMRNCLHVPRYGAELGREIRLLIQKYVLKPKTYVPESTLEDIRVTNIQKMRDRVAKQKSLTAK